MMQYLGVGLDGRDYYKDADIIIPGEKHQPIEDQVNDKIHELAAAIRNLAPK